MLENNLLSDRFLIQVGLADPGGSGTFQLSGSVALIFPKMTVTADIIQIIVRIGLVNMSFDSERLISMIT